MNCYYKRVSFFLTRVAPILSICADISTRANAPIAETDNGSDAASPPTIFSGGCHSGRLLPSNQLSSLVGAVPAAASTPLAGAISISNQLSSLVGAIPAASSPLAGAISAYPPASCHLWWVPFPPPPPLWRVPSPISGGCHSRRLLPFQPAIISGGCSLHLLPSIQQVPSKPPPSLHQLSPNDLPFPPRTAFSIPTLPPHNPYSTPRSLTTLLPPIPPCPHPTTLQTTPLPTLPRQ